MHVVRLDDSRVEVNDEGRPAVIEVLCDECETALKFEDFDDAGVQDALPVVEQPPVRNFMSERVPERVLEVGKEPGLVEELGGLQMR